jgi:hypothetical protein
MTVVRGILSGLEFGQAVENLGKDLAPSAKTLAFESISTNSTAYEGKTPKGVEFLGNKTECALLGFTKKLGCDFMVSNSFLLLLFLLLLLLLLFCIVFSFTLSKPLHAFVLHKRKSVRPLR